MVRIREDDAPTPWGGKVAPMNSAKYYRNIPSPLGEMIALAERGAVAGLWFTDQKFLPRPDEEWRHAPDLPLFTALEEQLEAYFRGERQLFDLPLAPQGTPFRQAVWELLRTIPFGATTTYGALAQQLALLRPPPLPCPQAVGGAVGHNPLTIIIPCHRVVGANGSLTGYAGGLLRKAALLELERR